MKETYLTITQLSRYLKYKFDSDLHLSSVYLKGEISNFKAHTRGHYYFTLKDEGSRINAVMFSSNVKGMKFVPMDGMKVLVCGKVTVYEATGGYQIYVNQMTEDGVGNLYVAFEQLKEKLSAEGLFRAEHKKKIPRMPKRIGIVTASTGAAIRDILTTIKRRYPIVETILFPALVQGKDAAVDIAHKIEIANRYDIDTLIVGRGGGSIEDLWPFNEEVVARAIYHSKVPVISAVGHEVDFTIADFVADLRAPTPTAAAEMAVVDRETVLDYLNKVKDRGYYSMIHLLDSNKKRLERYRASYVLNNPSHIYEIKEQKLDMLLDRLEGSIRAILEGAKVRLFKSSNSYVLMNPKVLYYDKMVYYSNLMEKLNLVIRGILSNKNSMYFQVRNHYILNNPRVLYQFREQYLGKLMEKLVVLNPMNTLRRGYAIVRRQDDRVVLDIKDIKINDSIKIEVIDGKIDAKVMKVSDKNG